MDFFTPCSTSSRFSRLPWWLALGLLLWCCWPSAWAQSDAPVLKAERQGRDVWVAAQLQFDLPSPVEEALHKGVPLFFVVEADLVRSRWYWLDKKVASAQRQLRLAYQPLTRRWRLTVYSVNDNGLGLPFHQYFDTLPQSLAALKRVSRWQIADGVDWESSASYAVDLRFRLDLSQLPLPLQIGSLGQSDWTVAHAMSAPVVGR